MWDYASNPFDVAMPISLELEMRRTKSNSVNCTIFILISHLID